MSRYDCLNKKYVLTVDGRWTVNLPQHRQLAVWSRNRKGSAADCWQFDGRYHEAVGIGRTECSSTRQVVDIHAHKDCIILSDSLLTNLPLPTKLTSYQLFRPEFDWVQLTWHRVLWRFWDVRILRQKIEDAVHVIYKFLQIVLDSAKILSSFSWA